MIYLHVWLRWVVVAAWGLLLVVGSRAHSLGAVLRFHIVVTSLVGHWLAGTWASAVAAQRLSTCSSWAPGHRLKNCGAQAQPLHSMWNLPDQALNPCLLRWWGGFLTTWPPGKSCSCLNCLFFFTSWVVRVLDTFWINGPFSGHLGLWSILSWFLYIVFLGVRLARQRGGLRLMNVTPPHVLSTDTENSGPEVPKHPPVPVTNTYSLKINWATSKIQIFKRSKFWFRNSRKGPRICVLPGSPGVLLRIQGWELLGLASLDHFNPVRFLPALCCTRLCVSRVAYRHGSLFQMTHPKRLIKSPLFQVSFFHLFPPSLCLPYL